MTSTIGEIDLRKALEPFVTWANIHVDNDGWIGNTQLERIIDWFGPSDFRGLAKAAVLASKPLPPTDDVRARARELLAAEYQEGGWHNPAKRLRDLEGNGKLEEAAVRVIAAALSAQSPPLIRGGGAGNTGRAAGGVPRAGRSRSGVATRYR